MSDASPNVAVIGGGAVGTSTLFHLADRHDVTGILFERGQLGSGSTGKAAGGVRNLFTNPANVAVGNRAIKYFHNFVDETGEELEFRQNGYMYVYHSATAASRWRERAERFRTHGVNARLLSPAEAVNRFPLLNPDPISGALYGPDCGHVDPHMLTQAFARAADDRGATVHTGTAVTDVLVEDGSVVAVESEAGTFSVDAVVDAAGPWAARIAETVGIRVPLDLSIRRIMVTSEVPNAAGPLMIDSERSCYVQAEQNGSLLVCDTGQDIHNVEDPDTTGERRVGYDYYLAATETVSELVPSLTDLTVINGWSGLQSHTPDGNAIVGPTEVDGFYLACGFSGHGVQQSPCVGGAVADLIVTGRTNWLNPAPFAPGRFDGGGSEFIEKMA